MDLKQTRPTRSELRRAANPHAGCLSEQDVEHYIFNRASGLELDRIEEHLLVCTACQDRLQEEEEFIAAFRHVAQETPAFVAPPVPVPWAARIAGWVFGPSSSWLRPSMAAAGALALVMAVVVPSTSWTSPPEQSVVLKVQRGSGLLDSAVASSKSKLELKVDLTELASHPIYRLEVVDSVGVKLDQQQVQPRSGLLSWRVNRKLAPGSYWVRLYAGSSETNLLREFQLRVE